MMQRSQQHEFMHTLETPVGRLFLVFKKSYLVGISFDRPPEIPLRQHTDIAAHAVKELSEYFRKERRLFSVNTAFQEGTDFEQRVWSTLTDIPYGETRSYKWLAERTGNQKAARAVGTALGKNPLPIIFPCHRIIESDGSLGGYTPGTDIKRRLLEIEYYNK